MPTRKESPSPAQTGAWALEEITLLAEALESVETNLQGIAGITAVDVALQLDQGVVTAHHDGSKWWVKFGG